MIPRWVTLLFATIGALACIGAAVLFGSTWLVSGKDAVRLESTTPSPDGEFSAALATVMGGGAAGDCSANVYVFPRGVAFSPKTDLTAYRVAWLRCATVRLQWMTARRLRILATGEGAGIYEISSKDHSGSISVSYTFGEAPPA